MATKYLISELPLVMKRNGIKNAVELSVKTGIPQEKIQSIIDCSFDKIDFQNLNKLSEFFRCSINSIISTGDKPRDYRDRLISNNKHNGIVYFLKSDANLTKIGWTTNLKQRKEALERTEKTKTELVHFISTFDCITLEKTLHILFSHKRVKGEWFDLSDEDIQMIKEDKPC